MPSVSPETRVQQLREALARRPRVSLAHLPTPLERLPGLTTELGGPDLWVKRDDLTGLATGGNKTRMFEYVLAEAIQNGADTVVAGAALQSNYCRQLAAACAVLGLECHLLLRRVPDQEVEVQGGLLLDLLLGAHVQVVDADGWRDQGERVRSWGAELERRGKRVFVGRSGDESHLGGYALAYVDAFIELLDQAKEQQLSIDRIWVASCDTTQAGLALAIKHVGSDIRLTGVSPLPAPIGGDSDFPTSMARIGNQCADLLGISTRLVAEDIVNTTDYVGSAYGVLTDEARRAMRLLARRDGILLDPVYTSKAVAGLIDHVRSRQIDASESVVFIHTGGLPSLFAYAPLLELEGDLKTGTGLG